MKSAKEIALCGILSALSVVFLFLGSVITVLAYASPIVAGLVLIVCVKNINKSSAVSVFVVVSVISIFLMPDKECVLTYVLFFGYYPIIKESIDRLKPVLRIIIKLVIFNVGIVISQLICFYVLRIPFDDFLGKWGVIILLIMANVLFALYDRLMNILTVMYMKKFYTRVKHLLK